MIEFDRSDLFPLLPEGSHDHQEAQEHSEKVDRFLGLNAEEIEDRLLERGVARDRELWIGLPVRSLLTPYTELRHILNRLNPEPGSTVVDLGAGYGRMGFVVGAHYPEVKFIGYEYVVERVAEARRCLARFSYQNVQMVVADLAAPEFVLPDARYFFIYDYGNRAAIEKTLQDLRMKARKQPVVVIGRGRATRDLIERRHPWLSGVVPPQHLGNAAIYRSQAAL